MRIGFFELEGWEEGVIRDAFREHDLYLTKNKLDESNIPAQKDFDVVSVFIDSRITPAVLDALPNLKLITTRSTGYDHLDLEALKTKGVAVSFVPGYGDNTVAEYTFGLMLNLTRKIYNSIDQVKETGSFSLAGMRGADLKGKTLGVIGTGRIGREVIKIAMGFDMNVIASDPYPNEKTAEEMGFRYAPLEDLLKTSDVITLHCPLTKETEHLINPENIKLIKRGAYLVNTARGGLIDTTALVSALKDGTLSGAAMDVLEEEKEIKDELEFLSKGYGGQDELKTMLENHVLMKMPNVLITPHNAFNSQEALQRILDTTVKNISGFINGKPANLVKQ